MTGLAGLRRDPSVPARTARNRSAGLRARSSSRPRGKHEARMGLSDKLLRLLPWKRRALGQQGSLGQQGEDAAARFLKRQGYRIVARSDRGRLGEIDLVAVHQRTVVFVEVKTRRSHEAGHPAEAVDDNKQRRLTRLALAYLKKHELLENPARFDVIAVTWPDDNSPPQIEHFPHAFEAVGRWQLFS